MILDADESTEVGAGDVKREREGKRETKRDGRSVITQHVQSQFNRTSPLEKNLLFNPQLLVGLVFESMLNKALH